jgi:hypothetical protein
MFVTALAPLLFWAVERFFARPGLGAFAGIGLVVALVISTTHFQMAYFLFGAVGLYALFRAVQVARGTDRPSRAGAGGAPGFGALAGGGAGGTERSTAAGSDPSAPSEVDGGGEGSGASGESSSRSGGLRVAPAATRFALFLAASVAGAAGAGVQLLPAVEYVTEYSRRIQTTREAAGESGVAWSSSWSIHPEEAMSLVIPEFAGNAAGGATWATGTYWGRNVFKDNHEYAGLVILLLAAVAFAGGARRGVRLFFAGLAGVAFLFALGANTPVWRLFYEVVPGIRLFRAPSQAMFLFAFSAATLAGLGVDRILRALREDDEEGWRPVWRVLAGGAGALAVLALLAASGALTGFWTSAVYADVDPGRLQRLRVLEPYLVRGAFLAAVLGAGTAAVVWAARSRRLPASGLLAVLVFLVAADEIRIDAPFIQTMDFYEWARPDPVVSALLEREAERDEPYRLYSLARRGQDVKPSLHGIELAGGHHPNDLSRYRELIGMVGSGMPVNLQHPNVRRILNVRYILWPDYEMGESLDGEPLARSQVGDGRPYQSLFADVGLPRARLVASAVVRSDAEAVPYILSDGHDPEREVVLAEEPPVELDGGSVEGSVEWVERTPNRLELRVRSDRDALLVVADNWFPAWEATVDGAETPILRAYHTLRAVPVPPGESTVVMAYRSTVLARSALLSGAVLLGLVATGLGGLFLGRRRTAAGGRAPGEAGAVGSGDGRAAGGGEER